MVSSVEKGLASRVDPRIANSTKIYRSTIATFVYSIESQKRDEAF